MTSQKSNHAAMPVTVDVLLPGFPAHAEHAGLGWSTVALLHTKDGPILVDTGAPGNRKFLLANLKKRNLTPADIHRVWLTHLHWDHCYNVDLFPHAQFLLTHEEWIHANTVNPEDEPPLRSDFLYLLRVFNKRFIKDGESVAPGVSCMLTPGHTPGGASILIDQGTEKWIISGDAMKNRAELKTGRVRMTRNAEVSATTIARIKNTADRVLPGHDCWLRVSGDTITADGGEDIVLHLEEGVTMGGKDKIIFRLDD